MSVLAVFLEDSFGSHDFNIKYSDDYWTFTIPRPLSQWNNCPLSIDVPAIDAQQYRACCRSLPASSGAQPFLPQFSFDGPPAESNDQEAPDFRSIQQNSVPLSRNINRSTEGSPHHSEGGGSREDQRASQVIYWCIGKAWVQPTETRLSPILNVHQIADDDLFCKKLAEEFHRVRGWKGYLLSWKTCTEVDFIKGRPVSNDQDLITKIDNSLPDDRSKWDYQLVNSEAVHKLIAAEQIIYLMHNPGKLNGGRTTIGMIPKKVDGPLALSITSDGWGIQALHGFALYKILAWCVGLAILGFIFAGCWLGFVDKTALPAAFVPFTVFSTILTVAFGLPQLLNIA